MKLAVIFPGIGYHADKPLLYYAKKLSRAFGYETEEVPYGDFPEGVKGSPEKMKEAFVSALAQAEDILENVNFSRYDNILFISKSIGTAVASAYAAEHGLNVHHIYYTPVEETFSFVQGDGVVFHGTKDPWVETDIVVKACEEKKLPLFITENANHSLETGDVSTDLRNLKCIMEETGKYLEKVGAENVLKEGEKSEEGGACAETDRDGAESYLIRDTTRAQREQIVKESLGYGDIGCEDCMDGYEMYLPYIEGKKELKEITMEYRARYLKNMDREERGRCQMW